MHDVLRLFTHMMELYVIENYREVYPQRKGSPLTDALIEDCLCEAGFGDVEIMRTDKGKPYVKGKRNMWESSGEKQAVHISVSHSGVYFVCAVADCPIGVDIQERRRANAEGISRRYFSEREQEYVKTFGEKGFFTIWTRKEAYSKITGLGLEELMKGTEVLDRDDIAFVDFQLEDGIYCSCCIMKGQDR